MQIKKKKFIQSINYGVAYRNTGGKGVVDAARPHFDSSRHSDLAS